MARANRIRRTLTIRVTEPPAAGVDGTPGARFATGWQRFTIHGNMISGDGIPAAMPSDPIFVAGFLAAKNAWEAHHYAVNWMEA